MRNSIIICVLLLFASCIAESEGYNNSTVLAEGPDWRNVRRGLHSSYHNKANSKELYPHAESWFMDWTRYTTLLSSCTLNLKEMAKKFCAPQNFAKGFGSGFEKFTKKPRFCPGVYLRMKWAGTPRKCTPKKLPSYADATMREMGAGNLCTCNQYKGDIAECGIRQPGRTSGILSILRSVARRFQYKKGNKFSRWDKPLIATVARQVNTIADIIRLVLQSFTGGSTYAALKQIDVAICHNWSPDFRWNKGVNRFGGNIGSRSQIYGTLVKELGYFSLEGLSKPLGIRQNSKVYKECKKFAAGLDEANFQHPDHNKKHGLYIPLSRMLDSGGQWFYKRLAPQVSGGMNDPGLMSYQNSQQGTYDYLYGWGFDSYRLSVREFNIAMRVEAENQCQFVHVMNSERVAIDEFAQVDRPWKNGHTSATRMIHDYCFSTLLPAGEYASLILKKQEEVSKLLATAQVRVFEPLKKYMRSRYPEKDRRTLTTLLRTNYEFLGSLLKVSDELNIQNYYNGWGDLHVAIDPCKLLDGLEDFSEVKTHAGSTRMLPHSLKEGRRCFYNEQNQSIMDENIPLTMPTIGNVNYEQFPINDKISIFSQSFYENDKIWGRPHPDVCIMSFENWNGYCSWEGLLAEQSGPRGNTSGSVSPQSLTRIPDNLDHYPKKKDEVEDPEPHKEGEDAPVDCEPLLPAGKKKYKSFDYYFYWAKCFLSASKVGHGLFNEVISFLDTKSVQKYDSSWKHNTIGYADEHTGWSLGEDVHQSRRFAKMRRYSGIASKAKSFIGPGIAIFDGFRFFSARLESLFRCLYVTDWFVGCMIECVWFLDTFLSTIPIFDWAGWWIANAIAKVFNNPIAEMLKATKIAHASVCVFIEWYIRNGPVAHLIKKAYLTSAILKDNAEHGQYSIVALLGWSKEWLPADEQP